MKILQLLARETELFEEEEGVKVLERATKQVEIVFSNVFNDKIDDLELECLNKTLESLHFFGKLGVSGVHVATGLTPGPYPLTECHILFCSSTSWRIRSKKIYCEEAFINAVEAEVALFNQSI